ncbi:MAG: hypothetical protein JJW01_02995, partial [Alphaproteobacteria bacterium]|nr:hypothetical protein [Rickettsiales bacterium]
MFIKFCLEQKRAKLLLLVITVVTLLSSCTSVHNITNGSCNVARQSQACHDKCSGFDGDERPLWCYRLFCVHGSPIYGSWCDGLDPNMLPTQTELDQQKANPAFQKFIGTANAPDASKVSDNGFAFLSVVASNRVTPADKVAIGYVGEGVGGHSNNTMIENIKRKVIVYEGQNAIIFPEDEVRLPSGEFQNANGTITISGTPVSVALISPTGSNYVIGSDGKYYYARGGTSHVAKILGFTYNNDTTMGSANKDALVNDSLAAYNPFDFVMFNNYSSDPTKVVIGGAMPTNGWSKADMNSGSNYRFLSEKINLSITNFLSQNVDIVSNSNNKFVLNLGFEGFRDGRQLANGFDILRTVGTSSAGNGIFGEYGENNVSYMLVNTCSPDDINCQGAFAGTKSFLNGTFASGLQMLFDGTRFYTGGQGANISSGYMHKGGNNFDISDINQVSQKIYETLSDSNYENGLFVVSSGFSSVNNTGGAKDLFYKSNTNFVPGEDNGMATTDDWYSERVWYKSSNIFQTTGGVSNKFYDYENTPLGSARSK